MKTLQEIWDECEIYITELNPQKSQEEVEYFLERVYEEWKIGELTEDDERYTTTRDEASEFISQKWNEIESNSLKGFISHDTI